MFIPIDVSPASYMPGFNCARGSFASDPFMPGGSGGAGPAQTDSRLPSPILIVFVASLLAPPVLRRWRRRAGAGFWALQPYPANRHGGQRQTANSIQIRQSLHRFSSKVRFLFQHGLHNLDFGALGIVCVGREIEKLRVLARARGIEQIFHHNQRAVVMLNHSRQK